MLKKISLFAFLILLSPEMFANNQRKTPVEKFEKNIGTYFEIPVIDLERAMRFYSAVFGCEFSRETIHGNEMALFPFKSNTTGITGALAKGDTYRPSTSGSLIYLSSENIEVTLAKVTSQGGKILFPKSPAGEYGYVAEFKDLEGNRIALFESK